MGKRKGTFDDVVPIVSDQDGLEGDVFEIRQMSEDNDDDSGFLEFDQHDGDESDSGGQAGG